MVWVIPDVVLTAIVTEEDFWKGSECTTLKYATLACGLFWAEGNWEKTDTWLLVYTTKGRTILSHWTWDITLDSNQPWDGTRGTYITFLTNWPVSSISVAQILVLSAPVLNRNMETITEEKERVALLLCQSKGKHSRLGPQELCPRPWWVEKGYNRQEYGSKTLCKVS